jgi:arsenite/tail-anchored protein-transporting ATPase
MAAAAAMQYAKVHSKKNILLFTTDPAPSLSDSLGQKLGSEPTSIKGIPNIWGMEIDATYEIEKFKKKYGNEILDILQQGTYLSDQETEQMFTLDIPGLDEVMGLKKIMDFMGADEKENGKVRKSFDTYILDTAPTGHTLRLLALPELLDNWIKFLAELRWKYHYMRERFSRDSKKVQEKADDFLLEMKKTVKQVRELLQDPKRTSFVVVTVPEAMVVAETEDLLAELKQLNVPVKVVIINHVLPDDPSSFVQEKRKMQQKYMKAFKKSFPTLEIVEIEEQASDVIGVKQLQKLGERLNV